MVSNVSRTSSHVSTAERQPEQLMKESTDLLGSLGEEVVLKV
jgi:hypothetical protein